MRFHPFDVSAGDHDQGSFAEITSFPAAIEAHAQRPGPDRRMIDHRFGLDDYGKALDALANDPTAHKVVITA